MCPLRYCGNTTTNSPTGPPIIDPELPWKEACKNCGDCCQDTPEYAAACPKWVEDYCEIDDVTGDWMRENCRVSCGLCDPTACVNNEFYTNICKNWANKYCEEEEHGYGAFMKANCPRACCCRLNKCDCGDLCEDQPEYGHLCPDWANLGNFCYHQVYGEWMRLTCPESCKICPWQIDDEDEQ